MRIAHGKTVCLTYTLTLTDGTRIDSSDESGTWTYVHGFTRMPPGLVKGLEGCGIGEHVRLALPPEEAFGSIDPDAFRDFPVDDLPEAARYVGYSGEVAGPEGSVIGFRIHAVHETTVTLDLNHPLAGEHVVFEVTILHVQD